MALCVMMILLVIPASLAQEDMKGKVFLFPKETNTDYVSLTPNITKPLEKVSVCLRSYTDLPGTCSLFSLATPGMEEAFYIADYSLSSTIYINGNSTRFITASESLVWRHICVTWDSDTGVVLLWINGKLYLRTVSTKGSSIAAETSIVLGQRQNTFEGQSFSLWPFVGEISDVHMWDYVLTPDELLQALHSNAQGNIINWNALHYKIKGGILVQPKFQCTYLNHYKPCN
ncbi:C-reactive protein-like isoform X3 [Aquarana catesbeiana]